MIDYVDAYEGKLELFADGKTCGSSNNPAELAAIITANGLAEAMYGSSSMDFAREAGFESDDGAALLLKRTLELV
jgi:hypothetical protein